LQHQIVIFQRFIQLFEISVQQPHFQHVVDARLHFDQVKRFGYKIFRAGSECTQLVIAGQYPSELCCLVVVL